MAPLKTTFAVCAIAFGLGIGGAMAAETTTPATPTTPPSVTTGKDDPVQTTNPDTTGTVTGKTDDSGQPKAKIVAACTAEADKRGLAGTARGEFQTACEKSGGM